MRSMVLVALAAVCAVALLPGDVTARAGSGGSRGSRSFSSPARPSPSPAMSPSPSRGPVSPTAPPVSRPGFGAGLLGGLAGFALGGLLGGMLFGGGFGGGGFGLLDLLLIGGALLMLWRMMSRRSEPAPAYAPSGGAGGVYAMEPPTTPTEPTDCERGVNHIRQMDPTFDPAAITDEARRIFSVVQAAVTMRDMTPVAGRLTSRMYTELVTQCDRLRGARQTNHVEAIDVQRAQLTEAWQEGGQDYVTIYLAGSLVDYTLDDASGAIVDGNRTPQEFEEFWTFTRPVGAHPWKLSAIQAG